MWCLERLLWGRDRILRTRAHRSRARSPAACANVLTPDRIPEFCIPPRLAPRLALDALRNSCCEEARMEEGASRTDWDPRSQAALSLPHLPRARTAYGFCALLESPHTRRKESLFLADPAPRPRARTYGGGGGGDALLAPPRAPHAAPAAPCPPRDMPVPRPRHRRRRRLLRAPDGLLSRALRARRSRGPARARSVSSGDGDDGDERDARARSPTPAAERLEPEGAEALDADFCARGGRLRLRLLRTKSPAAGAPETRASGRRLRLGLRPPGTTREQHRLVLGPSRGAALDSDLCCEAAAGDPVCRLTVRVPAEDTGRPLGRRSLLLG
ncbi:C2 calcium-dependent domain-containing protein 4A [Heterocephalus glaber]|uniref:C2 calcium-dependent domain-containing protein 4A n=1 Tax=Heterocephalus glaber TaxID=10181 RepID=A0AAX6R7F9_HETGA|nr:C2 calcium-dependent domain-containing protein 4A [Heterocephalus glaber]XP_021092781.1 C2 calcium-dependent domain-containing protein 4A [Heterocephalus glaber]